MKELVAKIWRFLHVYSRKILVSRQEMQQNNRAGNIW
jgi:hypothetical protein